MEIGRRRWAIPDGYIPATSHGAGRALESHDALCLLNAGDRPAQVALLVFFADREPAGPYRIDVPARRTRHLRLNDLADPEPLPRGTDLAVVLEADVPVVVQHSRLDSRQAESALMTTIAFPAET